MFDFSGHKLEFLGMQSLPTLGDNNWDPTILNKLYVLSLSMPLIDTTIILTQHCVCIIRDVYKVDAWLLLVSYDSDLCLPLRYRDDHDIYSCLYSQVTSMTWHNAACFFMIYFYNNILTNYIQLTWNGRSGAKWGKGQWMNLVIHKFMYLWRRIEIKPGNVCTIILYSYSLLFIIYYTLQGVGFNNECDYYL